MTLKSKMSCRFSLGKTTCFTLLEGTLSVIKVFRMTVKQLVLFLQTISLQNSNV